MKKKLVLTLLASVISMPVMADVTVNGKAIPNARIDMLVKERVPAGQTAPAELRSAITDDLVNREVIAQEAIRKGLDKGADIQQQIELARQSVLVRAFLSDYVKAHPVTDAAIQAEYDRVKAQAGSKEYHARHILVGTEAEAKAIIAKLAKGEKFDALAKANSKDPGSKDNGGDLGWFTPAAMVKPFADAVAGMQKGDTTKTPVQTQFGWHVIRLDDVRATKFPTLDEVKARIKQGLEQQEVQKAVAELRKSAKVEGL